jgi:hypothetical protein
MLKLRRFAWKIKYAGVKMRHPHWSAKRIEQEVKEIFLYAKT